MWIKSAARSVYAFFHYPLKVAGLCLFVLFVSLVVEGHLLQIWSLHRDQNDLLAKINRTKGQIENLKKRLKQIEDPSFIEKQAFERFDLVGKGDLVFIFTEENETAVEP